MLETWDIANGTVKAYGILKDFFVFRKQYSFGIGYIRLLIVVINLLLQRKRQSVIRSIYVGKCTYISNNLKWNQIWLLKTTNCF